MPNNTIPSPIRALIVDDEPLARANLTHLLRNEPDVDLIAECGSGLEAPALIRATRPDLLFLDVQMPERGGFDVLEDLGLHIPPAVIFVTAYDQYAIRAFEAGALDYLLKPFDDARFHRTLDRARQTIARARQQIASADELMQPSSEQIHPSLDKKQPPQEQIVIHNRLAIRTAGQVTFIAPAEIDWIEAADYYAALHTGSRTHLLRRTLAELEQDLDPTLFCRIHRSTIINLSRVRGLTSNEDGDYTVLLTTGITLRLSRRYRKQLQSRLNLTTP